MARQGVKKVFADLSKGLVTEGNPLSYPDDAAKDLSNVDILTNGTVRRRLGLAYDTGSLINFPDTILLDNTAMTTYVWNSVNGDPDFDILVVQIGNRLDFYNIDNNSITSNPAASSVTLVGSGTSESSYNNIYSDKISMASGSGRLFITGKYISPAYLTYNAGTVDYTTIDIEIRDFEIWKEGETTGTYSDSGQARQDAMSPYHQYNLRNAGWPGDSTGETVATCSAAKNPDSGVVTEEPAAYTYTKLGFFPSINNTFHSLQAGSGSEIDEVKAYSPWNLVNDYEGTSFAPVGKIITDAFSILREGVGDYGVYAADIPNYPWSSISASETVETNFRPSTIAFYAGRVWYAGTEGKDFSTNLYFSQVIDNVINRVGKCYQDADPTAEVINELVATDGGVISIQEIGKILSLQVMGNSLLVFSSNGVWAISGTDTILSFKATDFSIRKITDKRALSASSLIFARDTVIYAGNTAIYGLRFTETGEIVSTDISTASIKTFYNSLSEGQKASFVTVFDETDNKVCWVYYSTFVSLYDRMLCLDLDTLSYTKHDLATSSDNNIVSGFTVPTTNTITEVHNVQVNGVDVVVNGEQVVNTTETLVKDRSSVRFLTITAPVAGTRQYGLSEMKSRTFTDFGTSYVSYVESGFDSLADIMNKTKKAPIIYTHFLRTEDGFSTNPADTEGLELILDNPSSCFVSYKWDWGSAPFSNQFQAYKLLKNYTPASASDTFIYDRDVVSTKNRLRGRGTSLGFRFESEEGKDFHILGYGVLYTASDRV